MKKVEFVVELDKYGNDRMRVRPVTKNKWYEIVRYDCTHGFFHRDVIWPNGKKEKQEIR